MCFLLMFLGLVQILYAVELGFYIDGLVQVCSNSIANAISHRYVIKISMYLYTYTCYFSLGRDLMRERTRSRIQDGGPQKRSANTVPFLSFNTDFSTRNWYPGKFMFRANTCDIKFNRICPLLLLSSVWNLTQDARTNFIWCANVHCIKTTDARTHIKMR